MQVNEWTLLDYSLKYDNIKEKILSILGTSACSLVILPSHEIILPLTNILKPRQLGR